MLNFTVTVKTMVDAHNIGRSDTYGYGSNDD